MKRQFITFMALFLFESVWAGSGPVLPVGSDAATGVVAAQDLVAAQLTDTSFLASSSKACEFAINSMSVQGKPDLRMDRCSKNAAAMGYSVSAELIRAAAVIMSDKSCYRLPNDACLRARYSLWVNVSGGAEKALFQSGYVSFDNYVRSISDSEVDAEWRSENDGGKVVCTKAKPAMKQIVFFLSHLGRDVELTLNQKTKLAGRIHELKNSGELCVDLISPVATGGASANPEPAYVLNDKCSQDCTYTLQAWDENKSLRLNISGKLALATSSKSGTWPITTKALLWVLLLTPFLFALALGWSGLGRRLLSLPPPAEIRDALSKLGEKGDAPYSLARISIFLWTLLTLELILTHFLVSGTVSFAVATTTAILMGIQMVNASLGASGDAALSKAWLTDYAAWQSENNGVGGTGEKNKSLISRAKHLWFHSNLIGDLLYKSPASDDQIIFSRLQMIVFSLLLYGWIINQFCGSGVVPTLSNDLLALVGVSSGAYMGFKLFPG